MSKEYESTLNVWTAGALAKLHGLDALPERAQPGGRRIDVEVRIGPVKIALEAEQGQSAAKRREAIADADARLVQKNADCAIALCYPDGITGEEQMPDCRMIWTVRAPNQLTAPADARWTEGNLSELAAVVKLAPMQLGDPDLAAAGLSASLDMAVGRLSENQKREIARALDLPQSKRATRLGGRPASRWNHAAKRAMLVIATAMMFHSRLDGYRDELKPRFDNRLPETTPFADDWPPAMAQQCVRDADPIGAFGGAWDLWLAVDYKPIFATAQSALNGCPQDPAFTAAARETGEAALALTRDISGLRHDLLGRIFHTVLDSARYDGSFYTTTAGGNALGYARHPRGYARLERPRRDRESANHRSRLRHGNAADGGSRTHPRSGARFPRRRAGGANADRARSDRVRREPHCYAHGGYHARLAVSNHAIPEHEDRPRVPRR